LKGFTPYEFICKAWASQPERFTLNPLQQMPGLNIRAGGSRRFVARRLPCFLIHRIPSPKTRRPLPAGLVLRSGGKKLLDGQGRRFDLDHVPWQHRRVFIGGDFAGLAVDHPHQGK
ncbi:hypothetical protein NKH13_27660, partial [Mesorhizobium sp. M1348]